MKRRNFIKSITAAVVGITAGARPKAEQVPSPTPEARSLTLSEMQVVNLMHEAANGHKVYMMELDAVRDFIRKYPNTDRSDLTDFQYTHVTWEVASKIPWEAT